MSRSMSFESLKCWQQARYLAADIYHISLNGNLKKDFGLREQLRKSAVSIASHIAEGKERGSPSEYIRFLSIAKSSAAELRTQLIISRDIGYLTESDLLDLEDKITSISSLIGGLMRSIKSKKAR